MSEAKPLLHRVVVAAIIQNHKGEILAAQRPPGKWGAGKWEFPGGKVEQGETPRQALQRECMEELGMEILPGCIFDVLTFSYPDQPHDQPHGLVLIFIQCQHVAGEPKPLDGQEFRWVQTQELPTLDWLEADWPIVHQLTQ